MFLDLRIVKELWTEFSEVRILKGLRVSVRGWSYGENFQEWAGIVRMRSESTSGKVP
jgi:hypothetical protein